LWFDNTTGFTSFIFNFVDRFRNCKNTNKPNYRIVNENAQTTPAVLTGNAKAGDRISPWIILIAILNVLFHLLFYNTLGFHRDELLYFSLGQHLTAGYASVPPFTGFVAWMMIHISGYSLLSARIIPMLLSGVLVLLGAAITKELQGKLYAQVLTVLAICVTPFNLRGFTLFQPVCFDVMFWSLIFWLSLKWINTKSDKYLLFIGLAAGVGLLNKYLVALLIFSLLAAFLFSSYRTIFTRKAFYLAILIALVVFLPNLIWQIKNHLPVLTHMQALNEYQLVHVNRIAFFTDQLFMSSLAIVMFVPGIIYMSFGKNMNQYRPIVIASFIVLLLLAILRGKSYYTIGLFPLWIAAGGVYWETRLKKNVTKILLPALMLLITIPVLPMGIPIFKAEKLAEYFAQVKDKYGFDMVLRWETGKVHSLPQDYADMLGWDELAAITAKAYEQVPDKPSTIIYTENYGQAGAIMVIGKKYNLPEPVCFSESFFYWFPRNPDHEITSIIYINSELGEDINELFADCRLTGMIENPLAREYGTGVWLCTKPRSSFNKFWRQRVPQITNPFQ